MQRSLSWDEILNWESKLSNNSKIKIEKLIPASAFVYRLGLAWWRSYLIPGYISIPFNWLTLFFRITISDHLGEMVQRLIEQSQRFSTTFWLISHYSVIIIFINQIILPYFHFEIWMPYLPSFQSIEKTYAIVSHVEEF